jgi:hypothetical protein
MITTATTGRDADKPVIVVAGDFLHETHLFEVAAPLCPSRTGAGRPFKQTWQAGGAWSLHHLIAGATRGLDVSVVTAPETPPPPELVLPRAFHLCQQFPAPAGEKPALVCRITRTLGCESPTEEKLLAPRLPGPDVAKPGLLVIDDLGLGFRNVARRQNEIWPAALTQPDSSGKMVLQTAAAPDGSPLWQRLLKSPGAEQLTVVLPAEALRDRGAILPAGLSWDRTIDDLDRELAEGLSANDLGACGRVVVLFGLEGVGVYARPVGGPLEFVCFLYDPRRYEGAWSERWPGRMADRLSVLTAAVVRHLLRPQDNPLPVVLGRAVAAMRAHHQAGFGADPLNPDPKLALAAALAVLQPPPREAAEKVKATLDAASTVTQRILGLHHPSSLAIGDNIDLLLQASQFREPLTEFATAYAPVESGSAYGFRSRLKEPAYSAVRSNLLRDVAGIDHEELVAKGLEIVLRGPRQALSCVPCAEFGSCLAIDREEVERIHALRQALVAYRDPPGDKRPLPIAVFGPPGAGKTFLVQELVKQLAPAGQPPEMLTFSLAQFNDPDSLLQALQQVRDRALCGTLPVVFWEDFDGGQFRWLQHFLAPLREGAFTMRGQTWTLGRALFVFVAGTASSLEALQAQAEANRALKLPEFLGCLRGSLNLRGPNLTTFEDAASPAGETGKSEAHRRDDPAHVLRRAILLRASLRMHFPELGENPRISPAVAQGFLRVRRYLQGARSLAEIVRRSNLAGAARFEASALPAPELLRLHVTDDFLPLVEKAQLVLPATEQLAEAAHESWRKEKERQGYKHAGQACDEPGRLAHPRLKPYAELPEAWKEDCRVTARLAEASLRRLGCEIRRLTTAAGAGKGQFSDEELKRLLLAKHELWLRNHLIHGFSWAERTNDALYLHRRAVPLKDLVPDDEKLNRAFIDAILPTLKAAGYTLVKPGLPGRT